MRFKKQISDCSSQRESEMINLRLQHDLVIDESSVYCASLGSAFHLNTSGLIPTIFSRLIIISLVYQLQEKISESEEQIKMFEGKIAALEKEIEWKKQVNNEEMEIWQFVG